MSTPPRPSRPVAADWRRLSLALASLALAGCTLPPEIEMINATGQRVVVVIEGTGHDVRNRIRPGQRARFYYYFALQPAEPGSRVVLNTDRCDYTYEPTRWPWSPDEVRGAGERFKVQVRPDFSLSVLTPPMVKGRPREEWMKAFDRPAFQDRPVRVDCRGT